MIGLVVGRGDLGWRKGQSNVSPTWGSLGNGLAPTLCVVDQVYPWRMWEALRLSRRAEAARQGPRGYVPPSVLRTWVDTPARGCICLLLWLRAFRLFHGQTTQAETLFRLVRFYILDSQHSVSCSPTTRHCCSNCFCLQVPGYALYLES